MLLHYVIVGIGGGLCAVTRVVVGRLLPQSFYGIPAPILTVNILGCLLMGVITGLLTWYWVTSDNVRHFLIPGFLGGFTTFSAFAMEFGLLWEKDLYGMALLYALLSVVLSVIFFFIGLKGVRLCLS